MIIRNFLLFITVCLLCTNTFADSTSLASRVEVLERAVLKLQKEVDQLKSTSTVDTKHSESTQDVFDVSSPTSKKLEVGEDALAVEKVVAPKSDNLSGDKKAYDLALAALKDNKLKEAEEKFAEFLKLYPKSSLLSNVYFWYGETFFRRNLFDAAAINYLKGYKQFPKGAKASDSLLKLALCLGELNKKKDACQMLDRLESEFPSRASASIKRAADAKIKFGCK